MTQLAVWAEITPNARCFNITFETEEDFVMTDLSYTVVEQNQVQCDVSYVTVGEGVEYRD
jgi:hypothetical protein